MSWDQSSWPSWLQPWLESARTSTQLSERVTRLEVHQQRQESANEAVQSRLAWLERGLQGLAVIVLMLVVRSAPSYASGIADILLAILKR